MNATTDESGRIDAVENRISELEEENEKKDERIAEREEETAILLSLPRLELRADAISKKLDSICKAAFGDVNHFDGIDIENANSLNQRVTDLEAQNQETEAHPDPANPTPEAPEVGSRGGETPLYRICGLPEHVAARELTANQERARFIASGVLDYSEECTAGLVIDSRAIKRVITVKEGTRPHTQTVARIMDFLSELGKGAVKQKKRRGRKLIVFDPDVADRLTNAANHTRYDRGSGPTIPETVISG